MDWREAAIREYESAVDGTARSMAEHKAQRLHDTIEGFLRSTAAAGIPLQESAVGERDETYRGAPILFARVDGIELEYSDYKLFAYERCSECNGVRYSYAIQCSRDVGAWLSSDHRQYHEHQRADEDEERVPTPPPPVPTPTLEERFLGLLREVIRDEWLRAVRSDVEEALS